MKHPNSHQNAKYRVLYFYALTFNIIIKKIKKMMQSELLVQTSWPPQSHFHSKLDPYNPNMGFYEIEHQEIHSSINSTPENSLFGYESYDQIQNLSTIDNDSHNISTLDDVCRWLCDENQGIEEMESDRSTESVHACSPDLSMTSSDDVMELESQSGVEDLLKAYADAMEMGQKELANVIVTCIGEKINPIGPAIDRIAFNLFKSAENQGDEYLKEELMRNFKPAFRAFYDIFPYGRFVHFTANSAILEAVPSDVESIHIVDFDLGEGTQWPPVIEAVAQKPKSLTLTITSVKIEERDFNFEETKRHLCNYARDVGVNLKVQEVELAQLLGLKLEREFLAFNCLINLPHMVTTRKRTHAIEFLELAKELLANNEGIIIFGDGENGKMVNSSNYASFFDEKLSHYKALYESMEWGIPSYLTEARIALETIFVAPFISSLSWFQKWEEGKEEVVSLKSIGSKGRLMNIESLNEARELVNERESPYGIRIGGENGNEMVLEWRGSPVVTVSAWTFIACFLLAKLLKVMKWNGLKHIDILFGIAYRLSRGAFISSSKQYNYTSMALSDQLLLQPSWPPHSYNFHSNLNQYDPKLQVYAGNHHTVSENSSSISSAVNFPMLSDDCGLVNMEGFDEASGWLSVDDHRMEENIPARASTGIDHPWSPDLSNKSSESSVCVQSDNDQSSMVETDDATEIKSQTRLQNLLTAYADAMSKGQRELAKVIVKCVGEKINAIGSPLERLTLNLFQPAENQGEAYLKQESIRNFNPAFRAFYDIFPYGRFAHFTASSVVLEAIPSQVNLVHIVDFDIGEGAQWPPVIDAMARTKRSLTITSVKLEDHDSGFEDTKRQLLKYARILGVNLKVEEMELAQLVKIRGEFTAFNCMVGLPHMGRTRKRTQVLEFLKIAKGILAKNKGIVIFADGEEFERRGNFNDYVSFFNDHLAHYKALYESMEWGFPSYLNEARIAMETLFLAPFVSSHSWFQNWKQLTQDVFQKSFGLKGEPMSMESLSEAKEMVKEGETPYMISVNGDCQNEMVLEWRGTPLVRVSAWKI
ncbi:hypothetical protein LXL04_036041 [Taraxacum kok-saghyz]